MLLKKVNSSLKLQVKQPRAPESDGKKKVRKEVTDMLIKNGFKNELPLNVKWENPDFGLPTVYKEKIIQENYVT